MLLTKPVYSHRARPVMRAKSPIMAVGSRSPATMMATNRAPVMARTIKFFIFGLIVLLLLFILIFFVVVVGFGFSLGTLVLGLGLLHRLGHVFELGGIGLVGLDDFF